MTAPTSSISESETGPAASELPVGASTAAVDDNSNIDNDMPPPLPAPSASEGAEEDATLPASVADDVATASPPPPQDASKQSVVFGVSVAQQLRAAAQARAAYRPFAVEPFLSREVLRALPNSTDAAPKSKRRAAFVSEQSKKRQGEGGSGDEATIGGVAAVSKMTLIRLLGAETDSEEEKEEEGNPTGDASAVPQGSTEAEAAEESVEEAPPAAAEQTADELQKIYESLLSEIAALEQKNQRMVKHLDRIRSFSAHPGGGVAIAELGFHSDRLLRARQLEASKSANAGDQYTTFCTNQRDAAIRRAQNDLDEIARRAAKLKAPAKGPGGRRGSVFGGPSAALGNASHNQTGSVVQDLNKRTAELLHFDLDALRKSDPSLHGPPRAVETEQVGVPISEISEKCREVMERFHSRIASMTPAEPESAVHIPLPQPGDSKKKSKGNDAVSHVPLQRSAFSDADVDAFLASNPAIASNLSELSTKSNAAIRRFEEQEVVERMQRCVIHAKRALSKKLMNLDDSPDDGFDVYRSRISEREKTLEESFDAIKKIGDDISEQYLQRLRGAHQLVLEQQLGRMERLQQRLRSLELDQSSELSDR